MAIEKDVSTTIVKEVTRVTQLLIHFPFGGDFHCAIKFETRRELVGGETFSVFDAGEISRGPAALDDTATVGAQTVTFQQWLKIGEKFFDDWYTATYPPA